MLNDIEVLDQPDTNYWTKVAYTIPDTPHASIKPGETGVKNDSDQSDGAEIFRDQHCFGSEAEGCCSDDAARHRIRRRLRRGRR